VSAINFVQHIKQFNSIHEQDTQFLDIPWLEKNIVNQIHFLYATPFLAETLLNHSLKHVVPATNQYLKVISLTFTMFRQHGFDDTSVKQACLIATLLVLSRTNHSNNLELRQAAKIVLKLLQVQNVNDNVVIKTLMSIVLGTTARTHQLQNDLFNAVYSLSLKTETETNTPLYNQFVRYSILNDSIALTDIDYSFLLQGAVVKIGDRPYVTKISKAGQIEPIQSIDSKIHVKSLLKEHLQFNCSVPLQWLIEQLQISYEICSSESKEAVVNEQQDSLDSLILQKNISRKHIVQILETQPKIGKRLLEEATARNRQQTAIFELNHAVSLLGIETSHIVMLKAWLKQTYFEERFLFFGLLESRFIQLSTLTTHIVKRVKPFDSERYALFFSCFYLSLLQIPKAKTVLLSSKRPFKSLEPTSNLVTLMQLQKPKTIKALLARNIKQWQLDHYIAPLFNQYFVQTGKHTTEVLLMKLIEQIFISYCFSEVLPWQDGHIIEVSRALNLSRKDIEDIVLNCSLTIPLE
jgi:hypothetical protein